jgi:hypothetical protein
LTIRGELMSRPGSDEQWAELFRRHLPDEPVPRGVSRHCRAAVDAMLQDTGSRDREHASPAGPDPWTRAVHAIGLTWLLNHSRASVVLSAVMVAVLLASAVFLGAPPRLAYAATVRVHGGTATIVQARTGATVIIQANGTAMLEPGDELTTQTGTAIITCFKDQTTRVSPGARVRLVALSQNGNATNVQFDVQQGRTSIELATPLGPEDRFEVTSPSSTASVSNSAAMTVDVRSDRETHYVADVGNVSVTMGSNTFEVNAGEEAIATVGEGVAIVAQTGVAMVTATPAPTDTPAPTAIASESPPATATNGAVLVLSPTRVPETATVWLTPYVMVSDTPRPTITPPPLPTRVPASTATASSTQTPLPEPTSTAVPTAVPTNPPSPTATEMPLPTDTPMPTLIPTVTPTIAPTSEPTATPTPYPLPTLITTLQPTATATTIPATPTANLTSTVTPSASGTLPPLPDIRTPMVTVGP